MTRERLPALMDCKMLMGELGLPRSTVERIMRRCGLIHIDGISR